ncbi:MAG: cytochrome c family protein [Bacteroidota bacterium]|nr:cytochrome c family protein [Bacteroidota bacterium]
MVKSTFDFKPGDTLANFTNGEPFHKARDLKNIDVHGNQVKLLTSSKCFMSSNIECATCHNIHDNVAKSVALYSQACTGCHSVAKHNFCKMAGQLGQAIYNNCIDCHMPVKNSKAIVINGAKNITAPPFLARTHLIAIYPEESKKIMDWMKAGVRR